MQNQKPVKLIAYGCRDDEMPTLKAFQNREDLELKIVQAHLSTDNVYLAEGFDGVSIEGLSQSDAAIFKALAGYGIHYFSTRTAGYNRLDLAAAKKYQIHCANVHYSPYSVAEYTVMLMLTCLRKFIHIIARSAVMDYSLAGMQGRELHNMTVGIVGMGHIGKTVAKCLSGFGCRLISYTPHPTAETDALAKAVSKETLLKEADIITLHTPLTQDNYHMIDKDVIAQMKDGVVIINTARGGLINTWDLIDAVESGKVNAVGIDSFEHEENVIQIDHESSLIHNRSLLALKAYPNVVVSPHAAFYTDQSSKDMVTVSLNGLMAWLRGENNPNEIAY